MYLQGANMVPKPAVALKWYIQKIERRISACWREVDKRSKKVGWCCASSMDVGVERYGPSGEQA